MRTSLRFTTAGIIALAAFTAAQGAAQPPERPARERRTASALAALSGRYQGRPEQTERVSRRLRLGRDGRVTVWNIAGEITVTVGAGDEVSIEAIKRTRGDRNELAGVQVDIDEHMGRVDIRTRHTYRSDRASVDYTLTVPATAAVELKSISGNLRVSDVHGAVRAESVSGNITTSGTPRVEAAKSVSGNVEINDVSTDGDLNAGSISGNVRATGLRLRGLDLNSVSGDLVLRDVTCDRLSVRSVSGQVEYAGTLTRNGRYELVSHSGNVRLGLAGNIGFELNATSFSGSVRSEFPVTINGDRGPGRRGFGPGNQAFRATFGDGSAAVTIRTFSGNIVLMKR